MKEEYLQEKLIEQQNRGVHPYTTKASRSVLRKGFNSEDFGEETHYKSIHMNTLLKG